MFNGRWWTLQTLATYLLLIAISYSYEGRSPLAAQGFTDFRPAPYAKKKRGRSGGKRIPYRKIRRTQNGYRLAYGFKNFNGDRLGIQANLSAQSVASSIREFGFSDQDFQALDSWYARAKQNASTKARGRGLNATLDRLAQEYRKRRVALYRKAGFRYKKRGVVEVNIPQMVGRNWKRVRGVAQQFSKIANRHGYDAEDLIGSATAMVQTSLRYEVPADNDATRVVAGVMPPPKALVLGQGDCDTKSALLASVLMNWPNIKMVGLAIPGHYLMAFHGIPRSGDVYIEYKGLPFIMIESAGPAWIRPGEVGEDTLAYLESGADFRIQPIAL